MNFTGNQTNEKCFLSDLQPKRVSQKAGPTEIPSRSASLGDQIATAATDSARAIEPRPWTYPAPPTIETAPRPARPHAGARLPYNHTTSVGAGTTAQSDGRRSLGRGETAGAIIVIDPRVLFRDCLTLCLRHAYEDRRVTAYASIAEWMAKGGGETSAVVLLSTPRAGSLRSESPVETAFLSKVGGDIPVIIISESDDSARILHALKNGARGYIPTSLALAVAVEAVRLVDAGGTFVPVSTLLASRRAAAGNGYDLFTPRQIMVMEALHRGKANKQIALELNMRESTVKVHIRHIMKKLNARNRTEVAVLTSDLFEAQEPTDTHRYLG